MKETTADPQEPTNKGTIRHGFETNGRPISHTATDTVPAHRADNPNTTGQKAFFSVQDFGTTPWRFLDELIAFYCELEDPDILDTTVNHGRIWGRGKSRYEYTGMDIDPSVKPDVVGDHTAMPFPDDSWDLLMYDPPHVGGQNKSRFAKVYGTGIPVAKDGSLTHTYPAFLSEARRVLRSKGLLIAKLADCTHRGKFHFATAEFYAAATEFGFQLQGNHILPRKNVIIDPKWKHAYHPRQNHSTFMVLKRT